MTLAQGRRVQRLPQAASVRGGGWTIVETASVVYHLGTIARCQIGTH